MKGRLVYLLFSLLITVALPWVIYGQDARQAAPAQGNHGQAQEPEPAAQENSQEYAHQNSCSMGTLHGSYGWLGKGVVLNMPGLPPGPMAVLGKADYDGAGNLVTTFTGNYNGIIITQTENATYRVNPDCTGVISWRFGDSPLVVTQDGREVRSVQAYRPGVILPPGMGWVMDAIGKKITPESRDHSLRERFRAANFTCNPYTVAGEYLVQASGTVLNSPPEPVSGLSWLKLDPSGNSSVKGTFNFNGAVVSVTDTATGTELSPDCTSSARQTSNGAIQKIVFVNGGTEFFFLQLPPEAAEVRMVLFGDGKRLHKPERPGMRW